MLKLFRNQKGFTLVELMIVVVIVGILAAVAIPMYRGSVDRAKASEAVAALGSIRSAMRVYYGEHATYINASFTANAEVTNGDVLDITEPDLLGRYFSKDCYTFANATAGIAPTDTTFSIKCLGSASTALKKDEVATIVRYIDQDGEITK